MAHRKFLNRLLLVTLLILLAGAAVGLVVTTGWWSGREASRPAGQRRARNAPLVDQSPLQTAQALAALAETPGEHFLAQEALRLADHEVDLAFAQALRDATNHPAPQDAKTRELTARIQHATSQVSADQNAIAELNRQIQTAPPSKKAGLQDKLQLVQAQLDLDQDELADAQEDLTRSGGDPRSQIQRLEDEHKSAEQGALTLPPLPVATNAPPVSLPGRWAAWRLWRTKKAQLLDAQKAAQANAAAFTSQHAALEKQIQDETAGGAGGAPKSTPPGGTPGRTENFPPSLEELRRRAEVKKDLSQFDERIEIEQELSELYARWLALAGTHESRALHAVFVSLTWVLGIALAVLLATAWIDHLLHIRLAERRGLATLHSIVRAALRVIGVLAILVVIFGPPNQLATAVALTGAGLTVALKDFIVAFFGWFVLMGRNGIRVGDRVEINGVTGEVIEIGLLHTVILETGNWTDPGHPTGRRVSFVNSYALEGHYFNFSTAGQWMWDDVQVVLPASVDPVSLVDEVEKIVTGETAENARQAELEWKRIERPHTGSPVSAAPSIHLRPVSIGTRLTARYVTQARGRHELKARLYRAIFDQLRRRNISPAGTSVVEETSELRPSEPAAGTS